MNKIVAQQHIIKHKFNRPTTTATRLRYMTKNPHYHAMGSERSTAALHCERSAQTRTHVKPSIGWRRRFACTTQCQQPDNNHAKHCPHRPTVLEPWERACATHGCKCTCTRHTKHRREHARTQRRRLAARSVKIHRRTSAFATKQQQNTFLT